MLPITLAVWTFELKMFYDSPDATYVVVPALFKQSSDDPVSV
jgi:hypothetical protein